MGIANYIQNNDYNLVNAIKPFDPGYSGTMQEIATKQQYWRVGADRMKSIYDQAVGLDPQFLQNKEYLKNFMSEANKNLTKISRSDLSVFDNSQQATKIFEPLYDYKNPFNYRLMEDSQINKHYQKQQQLSDTYRTKDGGKEWNQNNDFYFRDSYQKYLQDAQAGNLNSIDSHFQNRKSYIPYYDGHKELLDIQEACKGYSSDRRSISSNELYFQESSKKGCTPEELALAFQTGLSDRFRQQAQIDGYAHFKGNEDELARQFTNIYITDKQKQIEEIKATIYGMKDGGISQEEMPRYNYYQNLLMKLGKDFEESKADYDSMTKGNVLEYIKQNYDKLAGQVYFGDLTNKAATAFRTDEEKNLVSTNPAGLLKLRLETDRANMFIKQGFDKENAATEHGYKLEEIGAKAQADQELARLKGELVGNKGGGIPQATDPVTGKNVSVNTITESDFIKTDLEPAKAKAEITHNVISDLVGKALGKGNQKPSDEEVNNYVTEIVNKQNSGEVLTQDAKNILEAYDRFKIAKDNLSYSNDQMAAADAFTKDKRPDLFNQSLYSDEKSTYPTTVSDSPQNNNFFSSRGGLKIATPPPLSVKDMSDILNGKNINGYTSKNIFNPKTQRSETILYYENLEIPKNIISNTGLYNLIKSTSEASVSISGEIDKLKTDFFTNQNYINSKLTVFNKMDFGKPGVFENEYGEKLKQFFHVTGGLNDKNGYDIVGRDASGSGVYVRPTDKDGLPIGLRDQTFALLRKSDKGSEITEDKNTQSYHIPNFFPRYANLPDNETLQKYNKVENHMRNIEESLKTNKQFNDAITIDTRELPVGGTVRYVGAHDIDYIISIYKEQGQPLQYVATYTIPQTGEERKYKAPSMDALLPQLDVIK